MRQSDPAIPPPFADQAQNCGNQGMSPENIPGERWNEHPGRHEGLTRVGGAGDQQYRPNEGREETMKKNEKDNQLKIEKLETVQVPCAIWGGN